MRIKGYSSKSDVLRNALLELRDKKLPDYIYNRSASDLNKRKKIEDQRSFESMTDYEFALTVKGGVILPNLDGEKLLFIHQIGNAHKGFPIDGLKTNDDLQSFLPYHNQYLQEAGPVDLSKEAEMPEGAYNRQYFLQNYNVDIATAWPLREVNE